MNYNRGNRALGLDRREKYKVVSGKIDTYENFRESSFLSMFLVFAKWELVNSFAISSSTNVVKYSPENGGIGMIELENDNYERRQFWIYNNFENFVAELKLYGVQVD